MDWTGVSVNELELIVEHFNVDKKAPAKAVKNR